MAWNLSGQMQELCNCEFLCPCWFDLTAEPDQGFCKSGLVMDVQEGNSEDVDLAGRKVVLLVSFPHTFAEGNATARLYVDSGASPEQQAELEAIYTGQRGGAWEAVAPIVTTLLPTMKTDINIEWGDTPKVTVGDVTEVTTAPMQDPAGTPTRITGAAAMTAFQMPEGRPARPDGASWNDPDIGAWEARSGMILPFNWQG